MREMTRPSAGELLRDKSNGLLSMAATASCDCWRVRGDAGNGGRENTTPDFCAEFLSTIFGAFEKGIISSESLSADKQLMISSVHGSA